MNAGNEVTTTESSSSSQGKAKVIATVAGIAAVAALLFGVVALQGGPNDSQQASENIAEATPDTVPEALPFVEPVDPCSLSLHDAIASHDDISAAFNAWSDHLRDIAATAPDDVAVALDDLATNYANLADAGEDSLSETATQVIASADGNSAATELVDGYLASSCS